MVQEDEKSSFRRLLWLYNSRIAAAVISSKPPMVYRCVPEPPVSGSSYLAGVLVTVMVMVGLVVLCVSTYGVSAVAELLLSTAFTELEESWIYLVRLLTVPDNVLPLYVSAV